MTDIKTILEQLVARPSVSPEDKGCQEYMLSFLKSLGFECQILNKAPVSNFFACIGSDGPLLVFAGHTDVVPAGALSQWHTEPYTLTEKEGMVYGRGVADMKGSLACMLIMAERFIKNHPSFHGRLGFLITSGEEGNDFDYGTPYVMEQLDKQGIALDYCVVGEPSSTKQVGDAIKIGRRGSLTASIQLQGKQGHVAYPHLAENPIHKISPVLAHLTEIQWDNGNTWFPKTSMQITSIHAGGEASNVIPGALALQLNFRFSTELTQMALQQKVHTVFETFGVKPIIEWRLNGAPFLTEKGRLLACSLKAVEAHAGITPELSTSGGTSDGRFIAPYGVEVIELGPVNATIHQVNECVALHDLVLLEQMYYSICEQLLGSVELLDMSTETLLIA
jgi:succinyl-diaminopimelate desuccinylase